MCALCDRARAHARSYRSAQHNFYCFEATYALALLHNGYGFPLNRPLIRFTNAVDGIDPSWCARKPPAQRQTKSLNRARAAQDHRRHAPIRRALGRRARVK